MDNLTEFEAFLENRFKDEIRSKTSLQKESGLFNDFPKDLNPKLREIL